MSLSEEQKAYETAIREDERTKVRRGVETAVGGLLVVAKKLMRAVGSNVDLFIEGKGVPLPPIQDKPSRKRSPTTAREVDINLVSEWMGDQIESVAPKQLLKCGLGLRTIAAACRALVEAGRAEVDKRGRYRLVPAATFDSAPNGPEGKLVDADFKEVDE